MAETEGLRSIFHVGLGLADEPHLSGKGAFDITEASWKVVGVRLTTLRIEKVTHQYRSNVSLF